MMQGQVNNKYQAVISLTMYTPNGSEITFADVLIDTGSDAEVVASASAIQLLGLYYLEPTDLRQVDDEVVTVASFIGEVSWNGSRKEVKVICTGESLLIGMGLLRGHQMNMDIRPGGLVQIEQRNSDQP